MVPTFFNAVVTILLVINCYVDDEMMFKGFLDLLYPGKNSLRVIDLILILVPGFLPNLLLGGMYFPHGFYISLGVPPGFGACRLLPH